MIWCDIDMILQKFALKLVLKIWKIHTPKKLKWNSFSCADILTGFQRFLSGGISDCSHLTFIKYVDLPVCIDDVEIKPRQVRLGEHSDVGTITLVFQLDSEGLQVRLSFNAVCLCAAVGVAREIYAQRKLKLWDQWKRDCWKNALRVASEVTEQNPRT